MEKKKIAAAGKSCIQLDIVFEILKSLPIKSLIRFKCVSKSFCSLISEPLLFIEAHQNGSLAQFHASCSSLMIRKDVIQYLNLSCFGKLHSLASTNGLVCLWKFDGVVAICNPFIKEHIFLPCQQPKEKPYGSMICCSIGFDPITKKPKVFKAHVRDYEARYWIFTIGVDKSWREIFDCAKSFPGSNFVCIGGVFYFVNRLIGMPYNIDAFSVGNEKLMRKIALPDQALTSILPPKIAEIKGQIPVLDQKFFEGDVKVRLYVLKGTDETERWVKHIIRLPSNLSETSIC
ncbi:putative F-box protein At1g52490 [Nicotiana tomentosiformis]|uniref:putative F-box protein At1g52490 n=1 Tax=Nicotiana tomentosiformis TaxID=4098 RepID=UPI00051B6801